MNKQKPFQSSYNGILSQFQNNNPKNNQIMVEISSN